MCLAKDKGEETDTCGLHNVMYCSSLYVDFQQKYCLFLRSGVSHSKRFEEKGFMAGTEVTWPKCEELARLVPAAAKHHPHWQQG